MREGQRILTILIVSLGLSVLVTAGIGALWWQNQGSHWFSEGKQALAEGQELGPTGDSTLCLDRSLERVDHCGGLGCEIATIVFLNACLVEAHPAPKFCTGVPAQSEIFDSIAWRRERCEEVSLSGEVCENLFSSVQGYCKRLRDNGSLQHADTDPPENRRDLGTL